MAWRRQGDKPLSEPVLTHSTDTYVQHSGGGGGGGEWVDAVSSKRNGSHFADNIFQQHLLE